MEVYSPFKGYIKWNPDRFSLLPDSVDFKLRMELEKDNLNGQNVLNMQLLLHNPTKDTVFLTAISSIKPYYNFVVTKPDCIRVWSRIQTNFRNVAQATITLKPGETRGFQQQWSFVNYEEDRLKKGKYLIYGGIEKITITNRAFNKYIELGDVGVGPATLIIKEDTIIIK